MQKLNVFLTTMLKVFYIVIFNLNFTANAQIWQKLGNNIEAEAEGDVCGYSISLSSDGSTIAVGSPFNNPKADIAGNVRVFKIIDGTWNQIGKDIDSISGFSIALSSDGNILAIGDPQSHRYKSPHAHVKVFKNNNGSWDQLGNNINPPINEAGWSISMNSDGTIIAIGGYSGAWRWGNGQDSGRVCVYKFTNDIWQQLGKNIDGDTIGDCSGQSLALNSDGSILAVGAHRHSSNNLIDCGQIKVFKFYNNSWIQIGKKIIGKEQSELFGYSVSISGNGNLLAIGAPWNSKNGEDAGAVRIYQNNNDNWIQLGNDITGEYAYDESGNSVSLSKDGTTLTIGAPRNSELFNRAGQVRVFKLINGSWVKTGSDIDGEFADDYLGSSTSINNDGSIFAVGAPYHFNRGADAGQVKIYNLKTTKITSISRLKDHLYPNPSSNAVTIAYSQNPYSIAVYNSIGQIVLSQSALTNEHTFDISQWPKGVYYVELIDAATQTNKVQKLIRN